MVIVAMEEKLPKCRPTLLPATPEYITVVVAQS